MAVIIFYMSDVGLVCCKKGVSSRIMYRKHNEMELSLQCERLPNIFDMLHIFLSCPQLDNDCDFYLYNDCVIYFGVIF